MVFVVAAWPGQVRADESIDWPARLFEIMDANVPSFDEGYSVEVTDEVCALDVDFSEVADHSNDFGGHTVFVLGEEEVHFDRTLWFLKSQTLVISDLSKGQCLAWIYIKPFLG
jgi:hypothetical protein